MTPWSAVAWREWRLVSREVLALGLLCLGIAAGAAFAEQETATNIWSMLQGMVVGLILGASAFAGDAAPSFLASRAIGPVTSASARLAVRGAGVAGLVLAGGSLIRWWGPGPGAPLPVTATFAALAFLAAALASAFVARALDAVLGGLAVATVAVFVAGLLMPFVAVLPMPSAQDDATRTLARTVAVVMLPALLAAIAVVARARRDAGFRPDRVLSMLFAVPAALAVLGAISWLSIGMLVGSHRLSAAAREWHEAAVAPGAVPAFPESPASAGALRAHEIGSRLGTPLLGRSAGQSLPDRAALPPRVDRELERAWRSGRESSRVPELVRAHLRDHAVDVREMIETLRAGGVTWPAWRGVDTPVPDRLGSLRLARLLACEAALRSEGGDGAGALEALQALRSLTASLRAHPTLLARLRARGVSEVHARVARHVAGLPDGWIEGERAGDLRREAWDAMLWRASIDVDVARGRLPPKWPGLEAPASMRAWELFFRPLTLCETAGALGEIAPAAGAARIASACELLGGRPAPQADRDVLGGFDPGVIVRRMAAAEAEWELTRVVLAVRRFVAEQPGDPPADLLASAICPGRSWIFERRADGAWRILPWPSDASWAWDDDVELGHVETAEPAAGP